MASPEQGGAHLDQLIDPERMKGWVGLGGWLHTEMKCRLRESNPDTVTHPSTNRVRRRVTSLIRPTPLPLRHAAVIVLSELCHNLWHHCRNGWLVDPAGNSQKNRKYITLHCRHRRTEPQPNVACVENLLKIGHVVFSDRLYPHTAYTGRFLQ